MHRNIIHGSIKKALELFEKILKKLRSDKKTALIIAAGVILTAVICLSELTPDEKKEKTDAPQAAAAPDVTVGSELSAYCVKLEQQLTELISSINGAGKVKVMVTLESSAQSVYATSEKRTSDNNKNTYGNEYIIIKSGSSQEEALLVNILQPRVRGVAVVCQGADSVFVKQSIIDAVSAVLDIRSSDISITPMG